MSNPGQEWIGNQLLKLQKLRQPQHKRAPGVMLAYKRWQEQFFYQRLGIMLWLFMLVLITIFLFEIYLLFLAPEEITSSNFIDNAIIGTSLLLGIVIRKTRWGKRHPGAIFLWASAAISLTILFGGLLGDDTDDGDMAFWTMVFLSQATLVPVRWTLHFKSQLILIVPLSLITIVAIAFSEQTIDRHVTIVSVLLLHAYLLWVFFISDFAVLLYERVRYDEFEARQTVHTFIHAVSHDLRNPVTGMQLLLKSLLAESEQAGSNTVTLPRHEMEQMIEGGERQLALINSLLESHNNSLKRMVLHYQAMSLYQLVDNIHQNLMPLLQASEASLLNLITPNLPLINGDGNQLWRVFQNLIANAIHHNPPHITVSINASIVKSSESYIYCTVSDDGVGMGAAECEQLFGLYTQGTRRRHLSTGLGLYIAQQIIEAHGGNIGVESSPEQGSKFWLTLPIA